MNCYRSTALYIVVNSAFTFRGYLFIAIPTVPRPPVMDLVIKQDIEYYEYFSYKLAAILVIYSKEPVGPQVE